MKEERRGEEGREEGGASERNVYVYRSIVEILNKIALLYSLDNYEVF